MAVENHLIPCRLASWRDFKVVSQAVSETASEATPTQDVEAVSSTDQEPALEPTETSPFDLDGFLLDGEQSEAEVGNVKTQDSAEKSAPDKASRFLEDDGPGAGGGYVKLQDVTTQPPARCEILPIDGPGAGGGYATLQDATQGAFPGEPVACWLDNGWLLLEPVGGAERPVAEKKASPMPGEATQSKGDAS